MTAPARVFFYGDLRDAAGGLYVENQGVGDTVAALMASLNIDVAQVKHVFKNGSLSAPSTTIAAGDQIGLFADSPIPPIAPNAQSQAMLRRALAGVQTALIKLAMAVNLNPQDILDWSQAYAWGNYYDWVAQPKSGSHWGIAPLDTDGKVPAAYLPELTNNEAETDPEFCQWYEEATGAAWAGGPTLDDANILVHAAMAYGWGDHATAGYAVLGDAAYFSGVGIGTETPDELLTVQNDTGDAVIAIRHAGAGGVWVDSEAAGVNSDDLIAFVTAARGEIAQAGVHFYHGGTIALATIHLGSLRDVLTADTDGNLVLPLNVQRLWWGVNASMRYDTGVFVIDTDQMEILADTTVGSLEVDDLTITTSCTFTGHTLPTDTQVANWEDAYSWGDYYFWVGQPASDGHWGIAPLGEDGKVPDLYLPAIAPAEDELDPVFTAWRDSTYAGLVASLGDAAYLDVGTTAGTVAAGNHNHTGVYSPVAHNHDGVYSLVAHLHTGTYEPSIAAGLVGQYRRGDKTWQSLDTAIAGLNYVKAPGSSSITTVGAITSGTWNAGAVTSSSYITSVTGIKARNFFANAVGDTIHFFNNSGTTSILRINTATNCVGIGVDPTNIFHVGLGTFRTDGGINCGGSIVVSVNATITGNATVNGAVGLTVANNVLVGGVLRFT